MHHLTRVPEDLIDHPAIHPPLMLEQEQLELWSLNTQGRIEHDIGTIIGYHSSAQVCSCMSWSRR